MAQCSKCGADSAGKFCAKCGTPMPVAAASSVWGNEIPRPSAASEAPPPYSAQQEAPRQYAAPPKASVMDDNIASALCYSLWFLTGILFLVLEPYKDNKKIRFHAYQAIFAGLAVMGAFWILSTLAFMPLLGLLFSAIFLVYPVASLLLWAILMYKAYNGERWVLPIVGPLAEKQA